LKIKQVLLSQPPPENEKSPYTDLIKQFNLDITFRKLIKVERITGKEFRQQRIQIPDYTALIFTSKHAVDHFFALAEEMRVQISDSMKYFCTSEAIALYLQKYVQYRKRKIFFGKSQFTDLLDIIRKQKEEKFIFICAENHQNEFPQLLNQYKINYVFAPIYRTVAEDLSGLNIDDYQMIVFFSPFGIASLKKNFPEYEQGETIFGAFGDATAQAIEDEGFTLHIKAPTEKFPSMAMAMQDFFQKNKK